MENKKKTVFDDRSMPSANSQSPFISNSDSTSSPFAALKATPSSTLIISTNDAPPAKRFKAENRKHLRNSIGSELDSKLELFDGPKITVLVDNGKVQKMYPKKLLCYNSAFLESALKDRPFLEQNVSLPDCSEETIQMIVHWMITGQIVFSKDTSNCEKMSTYLSFLKMAERLTLLGPFSSVFQDMKKVLREDHGSLTAEHIRFAAELPKGNALRKLIVDACVDSYKRDLEKRREDDEPTFKFRAEIDELDGFAADLLRAYDLAMNCWICDGSGSRSYQDPLMMDEEVEEDTD